MIHEYWVSTPLSLAPWQMLLATIPLADFAFIREGSPISIPFDSHLLGLLFFIGPIATSACFVISAEYGRRISTFSMSNFTLGVPLVGICASVILTNNHLTPLFSLGIILIIIGVILAATVAKKS